MKKYFGYMMVFFPLLCLLMFFFLNFVFAMLITKHVPEADWILTIAFILSPLGGVLGYNLGLRYVKKNLNEFRSLYSRISLGIIFVSVLIYLVWLVHAFLNIDATPVGMGG